ncbi:hypothetical protein TNCV_576891 [Trichonephila clavipes]|nr:hypothetical protein TNCV_576891 [Trichonephila clavipes]
MVHFDIVYGIRPRPRHGHDNTVLPLLLNHLRFDIFKLQEMKLPVRLINTTNERRLVQGHETPLRDKGDIEDVSSELDNGD